MDEEAWIFPCSTYTGTIFLPHLSAETISLPHATRKLVEGDQSVFDSSIKILIKSTPKSLLVVCRDGPSQGTGVGKIQRNPLCGHPIATALNLQPWWQQESSEIIVMCLILEFCERDQK